MAKGDYEPKDSRNVTGTAATPDGRWTNTEGAPPLANGEHPAPQAYEEAESDEDEDEGELIAFEPDPEFVRMIEQARARREAEEGEGQTRH